MKNLLILSFLMTFFIANSQELKKEINFKIPKKSEIFQIIEEDKKQVSLFFNSKKSLTCIRFNEKFEIIDSLASLKPEKSSNIIMGYSLSNNKYYTYWSSKKEINVQYFDFNSKKTNNSIINIEFENEKIIEQITIKNKFYIVTLTKDSSILNFYCFNEDKYTKKIVNLSDKVFYQTDFTKTNLYNVFNTYTVMENNFALKTISNESPASLTFSACKRKSYVYGNSFYITLDNNKNYTQLIAVNLDDYTSFTKIFNQTIDTEPSDIYYDSNSYLLENSIVQIKLNTNDMVIMMKGFDNIEIKKYTANDDEEISFKNSDIYQENKNVKNLRVLGKSNQFLRKIYNLNPSISCYKKNDIYFFTIGSVSIIENNNTMYYGGGLIGAALAIALSSNYSMNNINSYINRKVVYINCLFDNNFNHISGNVDKLAFDKLRIFVDENKKMTYQTVFNFNKNLYFAGKNEKTGNYGFYKFID